MPWPNTATSRATGAWTLAMPGSRAMRSQLRAEVAPVGRASAAMTATTTWAPASASRRAATNPSPPLLPGPHRMTMGPVPHRPVSDGERPDRGRDRRPGVLHEPLLADAERLGAAVGAGHRLGTDGRQVRPVGPAGAKPTEVEPEQGGSLAGSGATASPSGDSRRRSAPAGVEVGVMARQA